MSTTSPVEALMKQVDDKLEIETEDKIIFLDSLQGTFETKDAIFGLNKNWNIQLDIPILSSPTLKGKAKVFIKKVINKLMFWRVHPLFEQQINFNAGAVQSINYLNDQIENLRAEISLLREQTVEKRKMNTNYLEFENNFRGNRDHIKDFQKNYLEYITPKMKVLDLGCGRGEFVELLTEHNFDVLGVDMDFGMVESCKSMNLNVLQSDIIKFLTDSEQRFDCIFISQVIEHLFPKELETLIELCYKRLNNNGLLIMETPNPETILVSSFTFYLDFTHVRPIPARVLEHLLRQNQFEIVNTLFLHPFSDEEKLSDSISQNEIINKNFSLLNNVIFGARDYAVIACKSGGVGK